ncbi:hypothetical protein ACKFKF_26020 [Phormidesmis sp. 146-12]
MTITSGAVRSFGKPCSACDLVYRTIAPEGLTALCGRLRIGWNIVLGSGDAIEDS